MKIDVITMHAVKNYGSVLQTYATQKVLSDLGYDVEIINYIREKNLNSNLINTWTKNDSGIKKLIKSLLLKPTVNRWIKVFGSYLKENINLGENVYTSEHDLLRNPPVADIFCTGSDQVWNSGWNNGIEKAFYLSFVPEGKPRVAMAASIGKTDLLKEEVDAVLPFLQRYTFISMREMSGLNLIKNMGIENSGFCLDPTLLLSCEEWLKHAIPYKIDKKYVLIYQLNHDEKFDKFAEEFAKRKGLKLYRICTRYDQMRLTGKSIVLPEVRQLLSLLNGAEYVLTNSFHATAFCINLNKQFISIYPNEYSSRISDILKLLSLEERHLKDYNQYDIADEQIDYSIVNKKLYKYREDSLLLISSMLKNCINSSNNQD